MLDAIIIHSPLLIIGEEMFYNKEEKEIILESLTLGCTHKEIANFIFEDFGIIRTEKAIAAYCRRNNMRSLNTNKWTTERYEIWLKNNTEYILDDVYQGDNVPIYHICPKHGRILKSPGSLKQGKGCWLCSGNMLVTPKQYTEELFGRNIIAIEETVGRHAKIKHKCLICDNIWDARPNDILRGRGCPECAKLSYTCGYKNMTKEEADALGYPIYVYTVKLQYLDEIFYKIGITKRTDKSRYNEYSPYKILEELTFDEYDAWDAIQEEKELHEFFSDKSYLPKSKFSGWTECFKGII